MSKFTVGFVFDKTLEQVLLVHKTKPEWQAGQINGIGGKIEPGEDFATCIARECEEESTLVIPPEAWTHYATVHQPEGNVEFFAASYHGPQSDAKQGDYEAVEWFPVCELPPNVIFNLTFLVPMAHAKLDGYHFKHVDIHY